MKKCAVRTLSLVLFLSLLTISPCLATTISTPLDFIALSQSLWGSGDSASFGASGSESFGSVSASYDIGASSGSVSGKFEGDLLISFSTEQATGNTSINLSFAGTTGGGRLASDLGVWAKTQIEGFSVIDEGYALNIDKQFTPQIATAISASDSTTIGNAGINVLIAEVGADFDIEQTDRFTATAIKGDLRYSLRGGTETGEIPFSLLSDAGLYLSLSLTKQGTWDFELANITLKNSFATSFDAELILYEEHVSGVEWCQSCRRVLGVRICSPPYPCGIDTSRNELTLADLNLYPPAECSLNFNTISTQSLFSIEVKTPAPEPVPEPSTLILLASGGILLFWRLRSTRKA